MSFCPSVCQSKNNLPKTFSSMIEVKVCVFKKLECNDDHVQRLLQVHTNIGSLVDPTEK